MSVNGKTCWSKTGLIGTSGIQECGGFFKEERLRVTGCYATLEANMPMTVRVWTSLDADSRDESFAINDVVIQLLGKGISGVICVRRQYEMLLSTCNFSVVVSTVVGAFHYWQQGLQSTCRHFMIKKISMAGIAVKSLHAAFLAKFVVVTVRRAKDLTSRRRSSCLREHTRCNSTSSKSILGSCACAATAYFG